MFKCKICSFKCCTERKYDLHQYLHRNWNGVAFLCVQHGCNMALNSYSGLPIGTN